MFSRAVYKVRSIGLKWKLLIPFLFFSFVGTTVLVYVGLASQQALIKKAERAAVKHYYRLFLQIIEQKKVQALSLAATVAADPEVQRLLAARDDVGLAERLYPLFRRLKEDFEIEQFHLHLPPGRSFLRLHMLEERGDPLSYRKTVMEALRTGKGAAGLERGVSGLGIRGVSPVFHEERLVGSVGIGFPFGRRFVEELKRRWGPDFTVFERIGEDDYEPIAATVQETVSFNPGGYLDRRQTAEPVVLISPPPFIRKTILLGPARDSAGEVVALVEIDVDRTEIVERLAAIRDLMILIGVAGLIVSFSLTWLVASLFIRPIKEIVEEAQEIAGEKREVQLDPRPMDEIGDLAYSLNMMLDALKRKQAQIEGYARTLELRVQERTRDLVASEEKYRKLVDNLPLIVYRVLGDGTTEFINSYFSDILGFSPEDVVGNRRFWASRICGADVSGPIDLLACCWDGKQDFKAERTVQDIHGQTYVFMDRAIPRRENGDVKWIDGIMMDITELKRLQERALRTEEIKILGDISARFAHELRNPLATAGGFARRLRDSLGTDHPGGRSAQIIVEEVARLEEIVQSMLSTIEPVVPYMDPTDTAGLLKAVVKDIREEARARDIRVIEDLSTALPCIHGDEPQLRRALDALLRHAVLTTPRGDRLELTARREQDALAITIRHRTEGLAKDDLEQFFLPRFTRKSEEAVLDLPLAKIIVHRHGGKIDVSWEDDRTLILRVELPCAQGS